MSAMNILAAILFLAVTSLAAASAAVTCGPLERLKVERQWAEALGYGENKISFGIAIFKTMFAIKPDLRQNLINKTGGDVSFESVKLQALIVRSLTGLDLLIRLLDVEDAIEKQLADSGDNIIRLEILRPDLVPVLKKALLAVVPARLGRCFDEEAFSACFDHIAVSLQTPIKTT